jgi:hypothetical protein
MSQRFYVGMFRVALCVAAGLAGSCAQREAEEDHFARPISRSDSTSPSLLQMDEAAQAILAAVPAGDWPRIYAYIQTMNDTWTYYEDPMVSASTGVRQPWEAKLRGQVTVALSRLNQAATARDPKATRDAANDVDVAVTGLSRFYATAMSEGIGAPPVE